ncbi:MAG: hypothetical protein ACOX6E_08765 [Syntrophomonadaceae bacterium]|jgi:hypothetical protein
MRPYLQRLKSRKFLSALFNAVFIILNEGLGAPIDREAYLWITGVITAFILGESYIDGKAVSKDD